MYLVLISSNTVTKNKIKLAVTLTKERQIQIRADLLIYDN